MSLPEEWLIYQGWSKYILRASNQSQIPQSIAWRKDKIGFEPPQSQWLESESIKQRVSQAEMTLKSHGFIQKSYPHMRMRYLLLAPYLR